MPKDLREIIKSDLTRSIDLSSDHREKFERKLRGMKKPKRYNYYFLKIAATIVLFASLGYFFLPKDSVQPNLNDVETVNIGSISPEMKQIENYYLTAINYEMASLEPSEENRDILDTYLKKIDELTNEYRQLSVDLTEKEINEQTVNALITNLQMRLQLLLDLKDTLNEMKKPKTINNENTTV